MTASEQTCINQAVCDGIVRGVAVIGLAGVALIHLLDLPGKLSETPYMFLMYLGAIGGSLALAAMLMRTSHARAWAGAAALPALVIVGYVLSRTTGLPQSTDDIGNWGEPLGIASLFVEGSLVALSTAVLVARRARRAPARALRSAHAHAPQHSREPMSA
jgi:hypothetical protein